jgi:hypothetical protein
MKAETGSGLLFVVSPDACLPAGLNEGEDGPDMVSLSPQLSLWCPPELSLPCGRPWLCLSHLKSVGEALG